MGLKGLGTAIMICATRMAVSVVLLQINDGGSKLMHDVKMNDAINRPLRLETQIAA